MIPPRPPPLAGRDLRRAKTRRGQGVRRLHDGGFQLIPYTEGASAAGSRVTKTGAAREFWKADAHRRTVLKQFSGTMPFPFV